METIKGAEIFFNFIEIDYAEVPRLPHLVKDIYDEKLHGFVTRNVFSPEEVAQILHAFQSLRHEDIFTVPTGSVFPLPFATLTDAGERLDEYTRRADKLRKMADASPAISTLLTRLDVFFKGVSEDFNTTVPKISKTGKPCAPGNLRFFSPDKGGLFVHCGYIFQQQAPFYYTVVEPMALERQLSFFLVLQNSEIGGELTIYDMHWKDIKHKDSIEENNYVLDPGGKRVYLDSLRSFYVKPNPGDILIFSGGPIWHRVENIKGKNPRITFGGFLNFTPDDKGLRYWG